MSTASGLGWFTVPRGPIDASMKKTGLLEMRWLVRWRVGDMPRANARCIDIFAISTAVFDEPFIYTLKFTFWICGELFARNSKKSGEPWNQALQF
jgi:hypothetical protein